MDVKGLRFGTRLHMTPGFTSFPVQLWRVEDDPAMTKFTDHRFRKRYSVVYRPALTPSFTNLLNTITGALHVDAIW